MVPAYRVTEKDGWSYVAGNPVPRDCGPYRYRWEAQEYADELNSSALAATQNKTAQAQP